MEATIAAAIGLAGLAGWAALQLFGADVQAKVILGSLAALAQCAPLVICTMRALKPIDPEEAIASTVESTRMIALQAERLGKIITSASDEAGLSPTVRFLVNTLLDDVEQAAFAARNHERRMRGALVQRTRRHTRIKPRHDRVIVTTHDHRKLLGIIIDVSVSGVAVEGNLPRIAIGADVVVGSRKASAVRTLPQGMAFEFDQPIPAELLDAEIVL